MIDENTRKNAELATFRRLLAHLQARNDVQNIDLMTLSGFCRNCLAKWYREALADQGLKIDEAEARNHIYGMDAQEWKKRYQK